MSRGIVASFDRRTLVHRGMAEKFSFSIPYFSSNSVNLAASRIRIITNFFEIVLILRFIGKKISN